MTFKQTLNPIRRARFQVSDYMRPADRLAAFVKPQQSRYWPYRLFHLLNNIITTGDKK